MFGGSVWNGATDRVVQQIENMGEIKKWLEIKYNNNNNYNRMDIFIRIDIGVCWRC